MRTVVLTLAHRTDRMAAFHQRWSGPLQVVRVHTSTTGHRQAMRELWASLTEDTLVLEDDVVLAPGWQQRLEQARADLPADWDLLYLGGQHARPPEGQGPVVRCRATHRTHATVVRHASVPRLLALTETATPQVEYVDAQLAALTRDDLLQAYAVQPWLAGQAAGWSDITHRDEPERWWHDVVSA